MRLLDIAKKLNLSHTTVSRALNPMRQHLISDETRKRVLDQARKDRFVPNRAAQSLASGRHHAIGILLPTMFDSLFFNEQLPRTLAGIYRVLEKENRFTGKLIILSSETSWEDFNQQAFYTGVDGLLISTQYSHFSNISPFFPKEFLRTWKKPTVFINLVAKGFKDLNLVSFDQFEAARLAVTHLIKNGHRHIGMVHAKDNLIDTKERRDGFYVALKEHKLPIHPNFIVTGEYTRDTGYQAALKILNQKGQKPTALFCINDEMALGAIEAVRSLELNCPRDVAIMGFDGLETGNYSYPRLTTVAQPSRQIAEAGTQLLLDLIQRRVDGPCQKIISTDIILRNSV